MAYGARLESVLGESPRGFESPILRQDRRNQTRTARAPNTTHSNPSRGGLRQGDSFVTDDIVLRIAPRRSLLVSALVSSLAVVVPVSALFFWFAIPRGQAIFVVLALVILTIAAAAILMRQLCVDTVIAATELRGRGIFSPMVRVPLDRIASVTLVPSYVGQSAEPVTQLLVRDQEGHRLFRLRGNYWHPGDLRKVANALPVAATTVVEPMTLREFFAAYPGSAYWFENRPWVTVALFAIVIAVCVGIALGVMRLLDMPIMA